MGLYHALLCSSLLFISSASLVKSSPLSPESTISRQVQSTFLGQTDSEENRSPHHRGSGR
jgi:hypothetical protein